jgi:ABC-2 type transport system permease protein
MLEFFKREIRGNFYSWRGAAWLVAASLIFSLVAYLLLTDKELSLLQQGEMIYMIGQVIVALGIVMSAASASSVISGEIEGGTMESVLLTPITHSQIASQKLLSVLTIWAILYAVSIPYLVVVSLGTDLVLSAVLYVGLYGTILVTAISALTIAISAKLSSSKSSIMISLMIVIILLAPSLFFSSLFRTTDFGVMLDNINPVSHAMNSLDSVLVDNQQTISEQMQHIWPVIVFLTICMLIFLKYTKRFEVKGVQ